MRFIPLSRVTRADRFLSLAHFMIISSDYDRILRVLRFCGKIIMIFYYRKSLFKIVFGQNFSIDSSCMTDTQLFGPTIWPILFACRSLTTLERLLAVKAPLSTSNCL